ncbi:RNA helicase [Psidium guajava]|nr:RNA helicase [Psidium guajava]
MATVDWEYMDLAKRFVKETYYRTFDLNRADLVNLYQKVAVLELDDGEKIEGREAIMAKLTSLPFHKHNIASIDCVPDGADGGVIAVVMGGVHVDGKQEPLVFGEVIQMIPTPQGSFHISHDFFNMKFC